jgi:hypothetical protein
LVRIVYWTRIHHTLAASLYRYQLDRLDPNLNKSIRKVNKQKTKKEKNQIFGLKKNWGNAKTSPIQILVKLTGSGSVQIPVNLACFCRFKILISPDTNTFYWIQI